jgi:methylaspartate mutase sigma subunit
MLKILLGTIGSDVHSVANHLIYKSLIDENFQVVNIGVAASKQEWIEHINMHDPAAILIGSMNGDLLPLLELVAHYNGNSKILSRFLIGGNLKLGSYGLEITDLLKKYKVKILPQSTSFQEILFHCRLLTNGKNIAV